MSEFSIGLPSKREIDLADEVGRTTDVLQLHAGDDYDVAIVVRHRKGGRDIVCGRLKGLAAHLAKKKSCDEPERTEGED